MTVELYGKLKEETVSFLEEELDETDKKDIIERISEEQPKIFDPANGALLRNQDVINLLKRRCVNMHDGLTLAIYFDPKTEYFAFIGTDGSSSYMDKAELKGKYYIAAKIIPDDKGYLYIQLQKQTTSLVEELGWRNNVYQLWYKSVKEEMQEKLYWKINSFIAKCPISKG